MFRKYTKMNKVSGMDRDVGMMTEEVLSKVLEPFGKYEKLVMRMSFFLSQRQVSFLSGLTVLS